MNRIIVGIRAVVVAFGLVLAGAAMAAAPPGGKEPPMPTATSTAEHLTEAATYDREALRLDGSAERALELARRYKARAGGGSKQGTAWRSVAQHYKRSAEAYRRAAEIARRTATSHRDMANDR